MAEFDELVQRLREGGSGLDREERTEIANALAKFSGSTLMLRAEAADAARAGIAESKAERVALLARARIGQLKGTLQRAGVDVARVRPAEWQALSERIPESGEVDEAWIADAVSEFSLPVRASGR